MTVKSNILTGLALLTLTVASAQVAAVSSTGAVVANANIKGTPYLDDSYVDGTIIYGNRNQAAPVRYNAFKDLMEYKVNGQALVLDPTTTIKKVNVGASTFVVEKFESDGKAKFGYLEILDSGKVTLYSKKGVRYLPPKKGGAMDGSDQPGEFRRMPDVFYYRMGSGALQEVPRNSKLFIEAFPDSQNELAAFVKKEKISSKDEEELRQLIQYYNSL